jgi:hypothetical protein
VDAGERIRALIRGSWLSYLGLSRIAFQVSFAPIRVLCLTFVLVAISHRSALDISQMDMMKITFAGRFGADPFSKMVRELKYLRHSRLEAMYLHAALHYGLRGASKIPQFSSFKNRIGFAGYAPSTKYLKSMFISWFASHRLHIDRIMSSLSGRVLKSDHTFKVCRVFNLTSSI